MKKYKKLSYIFLILIIVALSYTVYATVKKDNGKTEKEKRISEIDYLENELTDIFNKLNNIEIKNYNVSVNNISKQAKNENSNNVGEQEKSNNQNSQNISSQESSSKQEKEFSLKNNGVLTNAESINWNNIKSQIEILYPSIPTITLDLYKANINQEDILNFNKEFDNLTTLIKEENKEYVLTQLSKVYDYMPKFAQNIYDDEIKKVVIETKNNILKAYSKLDSGNWNDIANDVKQASNSFSKLLTNTNINQNKQYTISKVYVMINELQNAIQVQDKSIFLIKYKNIIGTLNMFK